MNVLTGWSRHSIYDSDQQMYARSTDNRPRDLYRCGSLGMFLVSLLYERKCLRIDLIKINCCLNVPFIIWSLYVLNSVTSELQCGSCRVFIALAERISYLLQCAFSWHFKQNVLPSLILGVLVARQAQFEGISKFIQGKQSDQQGLFTNYFCSRIGDLFASVGT